MRDFSIACEIRQFWWRVPCHRAKGSAPIRIEPFYLPVIPGAITADQARKLKSILADREGPVLAFFASGNRCAAAFDLSKRV